MNAWRSSARMITEVGTNAHLQPARTQQWWVHAGTAMDCLSVRFRGVCVSKDASSSVQWPQNVESKCTALFVAGMGTGHGHGHRMQLCPPSAPLRTVADQPGTFPVSGLACWMRRTGWPWRPGSPDAKSAACTPAGRGARAMADPEGLPSTRHAFTRADVYVAAVRTGFGRCVRRHKE